MFLSRVTPLFVSFHHKNRFQMQNGKYSIEMQGWLFALVKGMGYLTCWWLKSLFRHRRGEMAPYRTGGHCLLRGQGWHDPFLLLLLRVQKSQRRQRWNRVVGKGNSRWEGKFRITSVSCFNWQVFNEGWSCWENQIVPLGLILQIFWYKLPFSIEEIALTSPWWVMSIKICKWVRFCLTLCLLGTNWWRIHFTVQKMLCFDLSGSEVFQVYFQSEFKTKLRS